MDDMACWAKLPGTPGGLMWPVKINSRSEECSVVYCQSDETEFRVKTSLTVPFIENYDELKNHATMYLQKKKKIDTLNCFNSDLEWLNEIVNSKQLAPSCAKKMRKSSDDLFSAGPSKHPNSNDDAAGSSKHPNSPSKSDDDAAGSSKQPNSPSNSNDNAAGPSKHPNSNDDAAGSSKHPNSPSNSNDDAAGSSKHPNSPSKSDDDAAGSSKQPNSPSNSNDNAAGSSKHPNCPSNHDDDAARSSKHPYSDDDAAGSSKHPNCPSNHDDNAAGSSEHPNSDDDAAGSSKHPNSPSNSNDDAAGSSKHPNSPSKSDDDAAGSSKHPNSPSNSDDDAAGSSQHPMFSDYLFAASSSKHPVCPSNHDDDVAGSSKHPMFSDYLFAASSSKHPNCPSNHDDDAAGSSKHPYCPSNSDDAAAGSSKHPNSPSNSNDDAAGSSEHPNSPSNSDDDAAGSSKHPNCPFNHDDDATGSSEHPNSPSNHDDDADGSSKHPYCPSNSDDDAAGSSKHPYCPSNHDDDETGDDDADSSSQHPKSPYNSDDDADGSSKHPNCPSNHDDDAADSSDHPNSPSDSDDNAVGSSKHPNSPSNIDDDAAGSSKHPNSDNLFAAGSSQHPNCPSNHDDDAAGSSKHPNSPSNSDDLLEGSEYSPSTGSEYFPNSPSISDTSIVYDSNISSEESEVFPMLSSSCNKSARNTNSENIHVPVVSKSVNNESVESDDTEEPDEDEILRADDNPDIYCFKILKSHTSKTGKMKKINRVYNSYQFCGMCKTKVSNFSQHISRNRNLPAHANCPELTEIFEEKDKSRATELRTLLRAKFNNEHNLSTLKNKKGELIFERRPKKNFKVADYGPCPGCLLWMCNKLMRKHKNSCLLRQNFMSSSSLLTQSKLITGQITTDASQMLIDEVFSVMNQDDIGKVAREDALVIQLGNQWLQKNVGNRLKRGTYTSQIMRLCARLLLNLRQIAPLEGEQCLWNYLKPNHFDDIVRATLKTAAVLTDDNLEKPSNARKLGFDIKRLTNGKIGISIMNGDTTSRQEAEDLLRTMEIFWGTRVAKLSNVLLEERKYNKFKELPKPTDIEKLNKSIEAELSSLDLTNCSFENFIRVAGVVSSKLVVYNRRRVGELQAIRLTDFRDRKKGTAPEHLVGQLTLFERRLLEDQEVMTVRGKTGRGVPVILPGITKEALKFLTDPEVRSEAKIKDDNPYVFAGRGDGVVRAYDSLAKACLKANLQSPELITSTSLRKYMATITQVLDLKPNEMEWVINHLGHSIDVHKIHYRETNDVLEKTQVAKLLLIQDMGRVGQFRNKSLNDIQMEDVVFGSNEEHIDPNLFIESEKPDYEDEGEQPKKKKKKPVGNNKKKWSREEEAEIQELFKSCIKKKIRPKPKDCLKAIRISKEKGGVLYKRKKDVLKKKMFRLIDNLKKNS